MTEPCDQTPTTKRSRSAIGRSNITRSKRRERELVTYLRTHGWPGAERTVRTGYRVAGRTSRDRGDIDGTPGVAWQLKDVDERRHYLVPTWLTETETQRIASGADHGVLVVKRTGHGFPAEWWAYVTLGTLRQLIGGHTYAGLVDLQPVRMQLDTVVTVLRAAGYGDALPEVA